MAMQQALQATRVISSGYQFQIVVCKREGVMGRRGLREVVKKQNHCGCEHRNLHTMLENDMFFVGSKHISSIPGLASPS